MRRISVFVMLTLSLTFLFSCKNDSKNLKQSDACESCKIKVPDFKQSFEINNEHIDFDFWRGASNRLNDPYYALGISQGKPISNGNIINILNSLDVRIETLGIGNNAIVTCALYSTSDQTQLGKSDIAGVSLYYVKNDKLNVCIYGKSMGEFVQIDDLNKEVSSIPVVDFYKAALLVLGKNKKINALVLNTDSYSQSEFKKIKSRTNGILTSLLDYKLNNNSIYLLSNKSSIHNILEFSETSLAHGCEGFPCELAEPGSCYYEAGTPPSCDGCGYSLMPASPYSEQEKSDATGPLYLFRDNILGNSDFGNHIIDAYYACSPILKNTLTPEVSAEGMSVVIGRVIPILNKLNVIGADSDNSPIFQEGDAEAILTFVGHVKALSDDRGFSLIMTEIEDNVRYIKDMSVKEVYNNLNS